MPCLKIFSSNLYCVNGSETLFLADSFLSLHGAGEPNVSMSNARFSHYVIFLLGIVCFVQTNAQTISWSKIDGPYGGLIQNLTVDQSGNVFAATSKGMYRSANKGGSWQALGFNLEFGTDALGVDSLGNIYAGNITEGLYKSSDKGTSWLKTNANGSAFATISGNRICTGGWATVSISNDNGKTWSISSVTNDFVEVLSIAEDSAGNIYTGLKAYPPSKTSPARGGGIYISSDNGTTWQLYGFSLVTVSSITVSNRGRVFISTGTSVYSAPPKSSTWTQNFAGSPLPATIVSLQIDRANEVVAVTDHSGIFIYNDATNSWNARTPSISSAAITTAFYNPHGINYAGTERDGIYFLDSTRAEWSQCGIYPTPVTALGFDGSGNLFAGVQDGVYELLPSASEWKRISDGLERSDIYKMYYSAVNKRLYLSSSNGLFYLPSGGNFWIPSVKTWAYDYVEVPDSHYAFIGSTGGIYRGFYDLWNSYTTTIGLPITKIYSLAKDVSNNLYAGTYNDGVFVSTDGGTFWLETGINYPIIFYSVKALAIDYRERIFAGTDSGGAYYSDDVGKNWKHVSTIKGNNVTCFLVNRSAAYFAGTADCGVFVSTDGGISWDSANNGLTDTSIYSLVVDTKGNVYAGTNGGVFKGSVLTTVASSENTMPSSFSLSQNYPNPFNSTTHIRFTLADFRFVTVTVYDVVGKKVARVVNEKKSPGTYEVPFDGSNLASGLYFYRITAGEYTETKKMILIR